MRTLLTLKEAAASLHTDPEEIERQIADGRIRTVGLSRQTEGGGTMSHVGEARSGQRGNPLAGVAIDSAAQASQRAAATLTATKKAAPYPDHPLAQLADDVSAALAAAKTLTQEANVRAALLAQDDTGQPEGLDSSWEELRSAYGSAAGDVRLRLRGAVEALDRELLRLSLPTSGSDSSAVLARDEIRLTLDGADQARRLDVAIDLARRGGEIAAQLVSPWGRAYLDSAGVGEGAHSAVVGAAVQSSLHTGDRLRRGAAEAFLTGGLEEARGLVEAAFHITEKDLKGGREMHVGRWRDTANRHADLAEVGAAGRSDAA